MSSTIDWATKKAQGRVKDIGTPWTEEELIALRDGKATVEELREGTAPKAPKAPKKPTVSDEKPLEKWVKKDLIAKAIELGLEPAPDATNPELVAGIQEALTKASKPE